MFRFNDDVRPQVERIVSVMQWANGNQYASQQGVYGMMSNALNLIVSRECGADVLDTIEHSRNHWNFGGNESWLIDVELAVDDAQQEIASEHPLTGCIHVGCEVEEPQPIATTQDRMHELAAMRTDYTNPEAVVRTAILKRLLLFGIDHSDLIPAQRQLRGNIRNLCCGMTDEQVIEYYTACREDGHNFKAECVLEFFVASSCC